MATVRELIAMLVELPGDLEVCFLDQGMPKLSGPIESVHRLPRGRVNFHGEDGYRIISVPEELVVLSPEKPR